MGLIGHAVDCLDGFTRLLERVRDIPLVGCHHPVGFHRLGKFGGDHVRIQPFVRTMLPFDLQGIPPLFGGPVVLGDHRHAGGDLVYRLDSRHRQGRLGIEGFHPAADGGAARDAGAQQAIELHIHTEHRRAVHLERRIQPGYGFAQQHEFVRFLEKHLGGYRQFRRHIHQFTIAQ